MGQMQFAQLAHRDLGFSSNGALALHLCPRDRVGGSQSTSSPQQQQQSQQQQPRGQQQQQQQSQQQQQQPQQQQPQLCCPFPDCVGGPSSTGSPPAPFSHSFTLIDIPSRKKAAREVVKHCRANHAPITDATLNPPATASIAALGTHCGLCAVCGHIFLSAPAHRVKCQRDRDSALAAAAALPPTAPRIQPFIGDGRAGAPATLRSIMLTFPRDAYRGSPLDIQTLDSIELPPPLQAALATVYATFAGDVIPHDTPVDVDGSGARLTQDDACALLLLFGALFLQIPKHSQNSARPQVAKATENLVNRRLTAWRSTDPADLHGLFAAAGLRHAVTLATPVEDVVGHTPDPAAAPAFQWTLGHRAQQGDAPASPHDGPDGQADRRLYRRVRHLIRKDRCSKALSLLARTPFMDPTLPECREQVDALHPAPDPTRANGATHADTAASLLGAATQPPRVVTGEAIRLAITHSPRESCAGPDGLRFEHFKSLLALSNMADESHASAGAAALDAYTAFVNVAAGGGLPRWYRDPFLAARLFLLQKQPGVLTPRPIAVRGVSARLVAKSLLIHREAEIMQQLGHQQVGVAVSSGAEGIALSMRQSLLMQRHTIAWDAKNAFNSIDRHKVLQQTAAHFPDLLEWTAFAYAEATPLFAVSSAAPLSGDPLAHVVTFSSAEGVQQGDPLASLLFCLAVKPALDELTAELKITSDAEVAALPSPPVAPSAAKGLCSEPFVVSALMDDVDVAASPAVTLRCIECFAEILKRHCNLDVNWRKSVVHPPLPSHVEGRAAFASACEVGGGTPTEAVDGLRCLGAPVSGPSDRRPPNLDQGFRPPVGDKDYVERYLDAAGAATDIKIAQILAYVAATQAAALTSTHHEAIRKGKGKGKRNRQVAANRPPQAVQDGNLLLLHCILPRLTYLLRVASPAATLVATEKFDEALLVAFATINGLDPDSLRLPADCAPTPEQALSALLRVIPTRQGGLALRSLRTLRSRAYTAGCIDAERVAASLTAGLPAAGTATLDTIPFADELGFTAALSDVLRQAATADTEALERYGRVPLRKRKGARANPPEKTAVVDSLLKDCSSVLSRNPYWGTDSLKLQHNISDALETAVFRRALNPPIAPGTSRSATVQSCIHRLTALSMKGVSAWFRTVPTEPWLELLDAEFVDALRYTLGQPRVPAFLTGNPCPSGAACSVPGRKPAPAIPLPVIANSPCPVPPSKPAQAASYRLDSLGLHPEKCTAGLWLERHNTFQDLFMWMARGAGLTANVAKVSDLAHTGNAKADLVISGFDASDCGLAGFPAFDTSRNLVIDFTIAQLLGSDTGTPNSPRFLWAVPPHSALVSKDNAKVGSHGNAAIAHHVTFWPAAATLDFGFGPSTDLLYKLIAAAAVRNGRVKWRWHRDWRPRFSNARARQRYRAISHTLGIPPLRYPDSAPVVLSPLARPFPCDDAFFDSLDFDIFGAPAPTAAPEPQPGLPPPPRRPADAPRAPAALISPPASRPLVAASASESGVNYLADDFVPLPSVGPRAHGAPAPIAVSLLPLTAVSSPPREETVVGGGEVVACTESDIASDSPVLSTEVVTDVATSTVPTSTVFSNPLPQ
jgi:hypothetical protein